MFYLIQKNVSPIFFQKCLFIFHIRSTKNPSTFFIYLYIFFRTSEIEVRGELSEAFLPDVGRLLLTPQDDDATGVVGAVVLEPASEWIDEQAFEGPYASEIHCAGIDWAVERDTSSNDPHARLVLPHW